jgi:hypothetical protein
MEEESCSWSPVTGVHLGADEGLSSFMDTRLPGELVFLSLLLLGGSLDATAVPGLKD